MHRFVRVALTAFVVVLVLLAASAAHTAIRVTCFDGNTQAVVKVPGRPPQRVDWVTCDAALDDICTFAVDRGGCFCMLKGCCGVDKFTVPVGRQRIVPRRLGRNLRLRCQRCPVAPPFPPNAICPVAP
jgi:hypothetical protein